MSKKIKDDYSISSNLRYIFQKAALIASDLRLKNLNTASVVLAMLGDKYSTILEIYYSNGVMIGQNILEGFTSSKEFYEKIMAQPFPFEGFKLEENMEFVELIQNEIEKILQEDIIDSNVLKESSKGIADISLKTIEATVYPNFSEGLEYHIVYSDNLKKSISDAGKRCRNNGKDQIDDENLLYSILNLEECSAKRLIEAITEILKQSDVEFDIVDIVDELVNNYTICYDSDAEKLTIPKPLENCCTILNNNYEKGVECDILGRDDELFDVWAILSKKQKSNAVLIGNAGVGKSAIVEALTISIVNETCPKKFIGYKVVELNVSGMVAGTKYRGEFEKKVEYFIDFINNNDKLIVFIDEMHHLMGAGSSEGSGPDLSGSLKPILARDKVKFIGATTMDEYKKYICKDNALRRRLETVVVKEPKQSEVLAMLKVKIKNLEEFHGVTVDKEVLEYIQICASSFNTSTCNPDKTLDLIDRAMVIAAYDAEKVTVEHVDKVFYKNHRDYEKTPEDFNRRTAYHEAGHFVVNYLHKNILVNEEVYALSIIPGFGFLGANILEDTGIHPKCDEKYFHAEIATLLAGSIAEEFFFNERTSGASNDFGKATCIARNMVSNYGLSNENYRSFSIFDEGTGNTLPLSDKTIDEINSEAKEIISKVYEKTYSMFAVETIAKKVEVVAEILLEKKIVSAKELEEAIKNI